MDLEKLVLPLEVADKAFNIGVATAVAGVAALVGVIGAAVNKTFEWANELDSIQDIIGGTNAEAAALNFTLHKSGVATDTFTNSMTILQKGLVKADGSLDTIGESFADWGIDVKDVNGELKSESKLIGEILKKYKSFGTQQEKVNFLTEVFGRNGAQMVDFFDTLAAEGGIDAVTDKVEALGLVIDPQKYEDFTRSLEEIKLAGLGLAIMLTERLMPIFQSVLEWVNSFRGLGAGETLDKLTTDFADFGQRFLDAVSKINWGDISNQLIDGINSIDWATLGARIHEGFRDIFAGLGIVVDGIDWSGVFNAAGTGFLEFMAGLTDQGSWDNVKATWAANWEALKQITAQVIEQIKSGTSATFRNLINDMIESLNVLVRAIDSIPLINVGQIPLLNISTGIHSGAGTLNNRTRPLGGSRDHGGAGIAGTSYLIGRGAQPEMFTPSTNGTFTPNADKMGATYNITVNNPVTETSEDSIRRSLKSLSFTGVAEA